MLGSFNNASRPNTFSLCTLFFAPHPPPPAHIAPDTPRTPFRCDPYPVIDVVSARIFDILTTTRNEPLSPLGVPHMPAAHTPTHARTHLCCILVPICILRRPFFYLPTLPHSSSPSPPPSRHPLINVPPPPSNLPRCLDIIYYY